MASTSPNLNNAYRQELDDSVFFRLPEQRISNSIKGLENFTSHEGKVVHIEIYREIVSLRKRLERLKSEVANQYDGLVIDVMCNDIFDTRERLISLGENIEPIDYLRLLYPESIAAQMEKWEQEETETPSNVINFPEKQAV